MASDESSIPYFDKAVSEWSEDLIGFEPTTAAYDPCDDGGRRQLACALDDARRAKAEALVVKDSEGRLTVWTKATPFWSP